MTDDELNRALGRFEQASKSDVSATQGYVLRGIKAALDGVAGVLKEHFGKIRKRQDSADALIEDLDRRVGELEARK